MNQWVELKNESLRIHKLILKVNFVNWINLFIKRSSSKERFIHNEWFCSHNCATLQVFCPLEWGHSGAHLNVIHPLCVLAWACAHVCEYMCIYFPLWRLRKGSGGSAPSLQLCPEICFKLSACCSCPVMLQALWKSYCLEQKNDWVPV